ncbi:MAG: DUF4197 domain-containing protein [Saprospiraceae bacterium]|nr:DUF4197 domain-containing protein [Saprospiraceae bacterium]MCB9327288.1 DUF4197 domain-containing protein [Lewinellaceae bacterium]HPK10322.1 DUF4197 domain-containing protein [Saprospiraceae bacterium]
MKKLMVLLTFSLFFSSCDPKDLDKILGTAGSALLTDADISSGLKEALDNGVKVSVQKLSATDGYYQSSYKILLPAEANKVIDKLKFIPGFENLQEEAIKKINRAAEDAATKAGPIFFDAIKGMSFSDVTNVLMGPKNAATNYLHDHTYQSLYGEFNPVIMNSLNKFGALDLWSDAINTYNQIPFITKLNPDLGDYVTNKALDGLFSLIEKKEYGIRTDISQRTSSLLKKVFAKQD